MKITQFKFVGWLKIKKRRAERLLDQIILQSRFTKSEYHFLEYGRRMPE